MGMDGLSMSGTVSVKEQTSAEFTGKTEQVMQSDPSNNSKQVQNLSSNRAVREKEEEEQSPKQQAFGKQEEEEFQDGFAEEKEEKNLSEDFNIEDLENPNKDFYVKLNAKDDIIELYDMSSDKLIETISGTELQELVRKLNMASGIFVNKKV